MGRRLAQRVLTRSASLILVGSLTVGLGGCDTEEPPGTGTSVFPDAAVSAAPIAGGLGGGGVGGFAVPPPFDAGGPIAIGTAGGATAGAPIGGGAAAGGPTGGGAGAGPIASAPDAGAGSGSQWCQAKQVFDRHCTACHDGAGTAGTPMGLKTYADFSADSAQYPGSKVFTRALTRMKATTMRMPPQGGVAAADLGLVEAWVQAGATAGPDATCGGATAMPEPQGERTWPKDCEKFYKVLAYDTRDRSKPYRVGANQETHPQFVVDAPWGNDEVQALAFRPVTDNKRVLHHWILYETTGSGAFISGWAPGQDAAKGLLPDDVGMYLPRGPQSLRLDMHYNNLAAGSKEELDASGVEICVASKAKFRPNTATVFMGFAGIGLPMVPANSSNYDLTGVCSVIAASPVHLMTASPHAHKLAHHMKFTVQKKSGQQIVLHDEAFDFEEQVSHGFPSEVVLETGDTVTTTCRYTNPTSQDIQFGENTDNEMCFNFSVYYPKDALSCDLLGGIIGGGAGGFIGGLLGP
jgi:Copper type II ascorbate-dependent monooxygenase, C-terminal domain